MGKVPQAFLQNLYNAKKNDKNITVTFLIQSNIIRGSLADISDNFEIITLSDISQNGKYLGDAKITILSEYIIGWDAIIRDKERT